MRQRRQWVRTAIGVVVVVKLLGLIPFLVGPVTSGDPQRTGATALAAEQEISRGRAAQPTDTGTPTLEPSPIPDVNPRAGFNAESAGLRELHEAIRRRSGELATREAVLSEREKAIAAAAKELEKKITHLESLGTKNAEAHPPAMEQLGKIYGAMKAEEAAPLLDRLDNETVRQIFAQMKQRQISAILPLMNPDKAVALTKLLGGRGHSRKDPDAGGG